jgi:hypothetical protein
MACIEENCQEVWRLYLQNKLVNDKDILVDECVETLATLFQSSCSDSVIPLEKLCQASDDNKLYNFFKGLFSCDVIGPKQMSRVAKSGQSLAMVSDFHFIFCRNGSRLIIFSYSIRWELFHQSLILSQCNSFIAQYETVFPSKNYEWFANAMLAILMIFVHLGCIS